MVRIMTPESINKQCSIHCNSQFLTSQISYSSKKCEIKCPESSKKLTKYKLCLIDADSKCPGGRGRLNPDIYR